MFRRAAFDRVSGYREACDFWEDLDFFLRVADTGQIFVLPEALYNYRFHANGSRLAFDIERVGGAASLMYRCLSERRAGRDYSHLLSEWKEEKSVRQKLHPGGFVSIGSARLWSGLSAGVLGSLWRHGSLALNRATALALLWAVWGDLSPSSLRLALRCLIYARDLTAGARLKDGRPHEWRFE
jgi:hypothetical protein